MWGDIKDRQPRESSDTVSLRSGMDPLPSLPLAALGRAATSRMKLKLFLLCCCSIYLLKSLDFAFSQPKQESLNFSEEDKDVLRKISIATEKWEGSVEKWRFFAVAGHTPETPIAVIKAAYWEEVQSHFATYQGNNMAIYNAAMNAALRCGKHLEGASVYDKCREVCDETEEPTLVAALRIFTKLQRRDRVREICMQLKPRARLHAAADAGDVETATEMLDLLHTNKLEVDDIAIASAIRSCRGLGENRHRAAKQFFDLLPSSKHTIVTFTALVESYQEAPLEDLTSAWVTMRYSLKVKADSVFAETYVTIMLQQKFKHLRDVGAIVDAIRDKDVDRLFFARYALADFESEGVELTVLCQNLQKALELLNEARK